MKELRVYYDFKTNYVWLILNIMGIMFLMKCAAKIPLCSYWWEWRILMLTLVITLLLWGYKYLFKHVLAQTSPEGLKIDHNEILKWEDITSLEPKNVRLGLRRLPVITIKTRPAMRYKYNFLQKRCEKIGFGAFSLPLYDADNKEIETLVKVIKKRANLK